MPGFHREKRSAGTCPRKRVSGCSRCGASSEDRNVKLPCMISRNSERSVGLRIACGCHHGLVADQGRRQRDLSIDHQCFAHEMSEPVRRGAFENQTGRRIARGHRRSHFPKCGLDLPVKSRRAQTGTMVSADQGRDFARRWPCRQSACDTILFQENRADFG